MHPAQLTITPFGQSELVVGSARRPDGRHVGLVTFNPCGLGGIGTHRTPRSYATEYEAWQAAKAIAEAVYLRAVGRR